ncbi:hypothetical protein LZY01_18880 [Levilactobacillus zymae]|uniref:Type II toxin-antitoxin system mRNA interferase toxin, RelE/StbE family n=1 Tax=Levilactobacillus zymae TaxID=267363 RepID=A0ABQ0WXV7_9LACO|nr:type II toxin-antitoxin system YafQ family toxin [Levilactobacillus zymae]KRL16614.1 hypothetical protein FD38_GL000044 [Levilactobacillus zymae DSM 19395]QFR60587.1 type II toxin-antitoxin system mRNA interferase toxin, RelE/StbE family [Levilactobacillus zymae]GEO72720.1 hypothetical protein LZY01_18880 [Levilactobacillus zymae]
MSDDSAWTILPTPKYNRQFKRLAKKHYPMEKLYTAIAHILANDYQILLTKYHLHNLTGDKQGILEIHLEPNWLLEYQVKAQVLTLILIETGSHQDLLAK